MSSFQDLIKGEKPILVDFYADWCAPCKAMNPILKSVKSKMGDQIKILKINVDKNQAVADKFNVRGIPTLILFQSNEIKWKKSGLLDENMLLEELKKVT
ncbi:MAG: thioredoxin [Bacteroidota bacterium]|jgi:thioredoxin 1|nr:thioredoxin [Bacteroidota bacterium]